MIFSFEQRSSLAQFVFVVAAIVGGLLIPPLQPAPAHAETVIDLVCPAGSIDVVYQPGLTLVSRPTTVTVTILSGPCTSSDPTLHSGVASASGSGNLSCLTGGGSGVDVFHWNNGATSTIAFSDIIAARPLGETIGVFNGTVTSGQFAGDTFVGQTDALTLDLLGCLSPGGVTTNSGPFTMTLTDLN